MVDVFEAITNRRSIRAFERKSVSAEEIEKLIDAARHAPSAGNIQPWEFIIVRGLDVKRRLSEAALNQDFIVEAPIAVVVCANEALSGQGYGTRGVNLYCLQDTAAAIQNLLLAAYALGLGACWIGAFREEMVREILRTPAHIKPVAIIPIGHAAETPRPRGRRPVEDIVREETF